MQANPFENEHIFQLPHPHTYNNILFDSTTSTNALSRRTPRRTLTSCLPLLVITSGPGHLIKCSPDIILESFQSENDQRCRLNGVHILPTTPILVMCFMVERFSHNENVYGRKWRFVTTVTVTFRWFSNSYCRLGRSVIRKIEKAMENIENLWW